MKYANAGFNYDGSGSGGQPVDIVIKALGKYTPWMSRDTGRSYGSKVFAQISMFQGTSTKFSISFVRPGTDTPYVIDRGATIIVLLVLS